MTNRHPYKGYSLASAVHLNYMRQVAEPPKLSEPTLEEIVIDICLSLGVDINSIKTRRFRDDYASSVAKKIYCHVAATKTSKTQYEIADAISIDRSCVSTYLKDVRGFLKIKRADFMQHWNQYITNSKIWNKK